METSKFNSSVKMKYLKLTLESYDGTGHVTFLYFGVHDPSVEMVTTTLQAILKDPLQPDPTVCLHYAVEKMFGDKNDIPVYAFEKTPGVEELEVIRKKLGDRLNEILQIDLWEMNRKEWSPHITKVDGDVPITTNDHFPVLGITTNKGEVILEL